MPSSQTQGQGQVRASQPKRTKKQSSTNQGLSRRNKLLTAIAFLLAAIARIIDYSPSVGKKVDAFFAEAYNRGEKAIAVLFGKKEPLSPQPPLPQSPVPIVKVTCPASRVVYIDNPPPSLPPPIQDTVEDNRAYTFADVNSMDRAILSVRDSIPHPPAEFLGSLEKRADSLVAMGHYYHEPRNYEAKYKLLKQAFELYVYILHRPEQDAYANRPESETTLN